MQDMISYNDELSEIELDASDTSANLPTSALDLVTDNLSFGSASIARESAWQRSPIPLWSNVLSDIKSYEARYHMSSSKMYDDYVSRTLNVYISSQDLRDWIDSYLLYGK